MVPVMYFMLKVTQPVNESRIQTPDSGRQLPGPCPQSLGRQSRPV